MSDETAPAAPAPAEAPVKEPSPATESKQAEETAAPAEEAALAAEAKSTEPVESTADKPADVGPENPAPVSTNKTDEKSSGSDEENAEDKPDVEMKDADEAAPAATEAPAEPRSDDANPTEEEGAKKESTAKSAARRKSTAGAASSTAKKLNKKASKARITHIHAKPGEHFFVKLKGYPAWPVIICDEDMLPQLLLKGRPVTAARPDGTYREDYADGGKRVNDRTFPVMYLHTNEFGWVPNTDLTELDPEKVVDLITDKMRKDLAAAHRLAAEHNSLDHYKEELQRWQEELIEQEKARAVKVQATPAKKAKKSKTSEEDEDVEMADDVEVDSQPKKSKKRKAEGDAETPQRAESVKKPKIKLTSSTPKAGASNGATTPKTASKSADAKSSKSKPKKDDKKAEKQATVPKEPELSPEEKHVRKEKEVLFLRHKLQKGLLTRDQEPKEDEMKTMSDFVSKLETFPDLEVSIIRATKINKVLKAILKLETIPKEEEFQFKPRSQALLDKWNKLLAGEANTPTSAGPSAPANGINGTSGEEALGSKEEPAAITNGETKTEGSAGPEASKKEEESEEAKAVEKESSAVPEAVEATA